MDLAKLQQRLMATFLGELEEHVDTIQSEILVLEGDDDSARDESLGSLFRAAHSLKGAARAVDVRDVEQVCHRLEDLFTAIREERITVSPDVVSLALGAADAIGEAGRALQQGATVDAASLESFHAPLGSASAGEPFDVPTAHPSDVETKGTAVVANDTPDDPPPPEPDSATTPSPTARNDARATPDPTASVSPSEPVAVRERSRIGTNVRVAEEKLDSLLAQTGELLVARQRIESGPGQLEGIAARLATCRSEWRSVEPALLGAARRGEFEGNSSSSGRSVEEVVQRTGERLRELEKDVERFRQQLLGDSRQLNHAGAGVQDDVHRLRMVPFEEACAGLERAVRDVARSTGKNVSLVVEGGEIEVDRTVLEGLRDPLLHLVRNAVDHGIESPEQRAAEGKPETAVVRVAATLRGPRIEIVVGDDGRGLDLEAIRERLRERGLPEPTDARDLARQILLPGFSTARTITDVSGRGVGMDVVKSRIEGLHGTLDISSQPGFGTRFHLSVPLTLTTISALFVQAGGMSLAIPSTNVAKLVRFRPDEIVRVAGEDSLLLGEAPLPISSLAGELGAVPRRAEGQHGVAVVVTNGIRERAFVVDDLLGERATVVKALGPRVVRLRHVSGATLLRSGGVALLLNASSLLRTGITSRLTELTVDEAEADHIVARRLLVVDDSLTTRSLMKSILESAGYDVTAAVDGEDAWVRLSADEFEAVVSDVDMPRLNGFDLTRRIRESSRHADLPVVLVTSRDSEEDKAQGVEAGADAYLVKSVFDQTNVLDIIERLV